ncbi:MAG: hypothetical protein KUG70_12120 [Rhodobacteraceae bacterium]|nr:hypothetical protein [Paracoccaceae bacterium]
MKTRLWIAIVFGTLILVSGSAFAAYAALQSCAVRSNFLDHLNGCPTATEIAIEDEHSKLDADRAALLHQILAAERELAARQCKALPPDRTRLLQQDSFREQDITALYGCWSLGSEYKTRDVDSGKVISYPSWQMCFDTQGQGKQVMRGDDGSVCEGPVQARYGDGNSLVLGEGGNLSCSDGGYIHRRDIACNLNNSGAVSCATVQPETEGAATVPFSRL